MDGSYSVLMSVYIKESPNYLKQAINSILLQSVVPNDFVLVCDGKLTQELEAVIDEYAIKFPQLFQIVRLEKNQGLGKALKIGISYCKNEYIARMDSDDISVPCRCEKQLKKLSNDLSLMLCGSLIAEFDGDVKNVIGFRNTPCSYEHILHYAKTRNPINHMTVMFCKTAVLEAGNYQDMPLAEDYYLWGRMLHKGMKMENINETLVYARTGKEMYKRRGGVKYLLKSIRIQKAFFQMGFISLGRMLTNCCIRSLVSIAPYKLRAGIYEKKLRTKKEYL